MPYTFLPLSATKPIYGVKEDEALFAKGNMTHREIRIQKAAADLGVAPQIHSFQQYNGTRYVLMDRIKGTNLADFYGENLANIPPCIWISVRMILQTLWNHGIEYTDITPYNFMLEVETERVWIVDFGHARRMRMHSFLRKFLNGTNAWNTAFG